MASLSQGSVRRRQALAPRLRAGALGVWVFLVYAFLMAPVIVVVLASFSTTSYLTVPPQGFTLRWFTAVFEDPGYINAIVFSLALALVATVGSLMMGLAAAYALMRRSVPFAGSISALLMAPLAFPAVVIGVALLQFYVLIGLQATFAGLALAHMVITIPYCVRTILASLAGTDPNMEDAARVLGANRFVSFWKVTLPLIRPGVVAGGLFSFVVSFDNVPVSIFLLGVRQTTLPVKIFTSLEYGVDPTIAAVSTILIIATGLIMIFAERWIGFHRFV